MLSRSASCLYWLGRYIERADFTSRLIEATVRLDSLSPRPAGLGAWESALLVAGSDELFAKSGQELNANNVTELLAFSHDNFSSIKSCIASARTNARAVRTSLSRDAWEAINRAWLDIKARPPASGTRSILSLTETIRYDTRGFLGALQGMLRNEAYNFISLGVAIERADNSARLLDVKYHILLPEGESIGGLVDRDQWTTILHTVSAVTAYRWLYSQGLQAPLVAELLILRPELPRSLTASNDTILLHLNAIARQNGLQGDADLIARQRQTLLARTDIKSIVRNGLHEWLTDFIIDNARLHEAIGKQFRFI